MHLQLSFRHVLFSGAYLSAWLIPHIHAVCDGNPHDWDRVRRCDAYDSECPGYYENCGMCEGVGGIAQSDEVDDYTPTTCVPYAKPEDVSEPLFPRFPRQFRNKKFYEVQIFHKRDPVCLVQIPAMTSNGTHCYKPQQGTFNYDFDLGGLRIDYKKSRTPFAHVNMTEHFYHVGTKVHPHIVNYGVPVVPGGICPCINIGIGIIKWDTPLGPDPKYLGRVQLGIEFLWQTRLVDHWVWGPHHGFVDVETGQIVRLWQPFQGLEVFGPDAYEVKHLKKRDLRLPAACKATDGPLCIDSDQEKSAHGHGLMNVAASGMVEEWTERLTNLAGQTKPLSMQDVN